MGIRKIIDNKGNADDVSEFLYERNLHVDDNIMRQLVSEIFSNPPIQGYLTISNALQWRLQYRRIVSLEKDEVTGVIKIL